MKLKSVSQTIFRQPESKLSVKLTANVLDGCDDVSYYQLYQADQYDYLSVTINAFVVMQYKPEERIPYLREHTVRITDLDLYQFNKQFQEFYNTRLSRVDMFTYFKSGDVTCNKKRNDTMSISFKSGGHIELEPSVIIDKNRQTAIPGATICINMTDYKTEVSLDEYEYLMWKFAKMDIQKEARELIMMKLLLEDKITTKVTRDFEETPNVREIEELKSVFDMEEKVEYVSSATPLKTIDSIDQLM